MENPHQVFEQLDRNIPISYTRLSEIIKRHEQEAKKALESVKNGNRDYFVGQLHAVSEIRRTFNEAFRLNPYDDASNDFFTSDSVALRQSSPYFHLEGKPRREWNRIGATQIGIHWRDFLSANTAILRQTMSSLTPEEYLKTPWEVLIKKLLEENLFFRGVVIVFDNIIRELGYQVSFLPGPTEGTILITPGRETPIQTLTVGEWNLLPPEGAKRITAGAERE